MTLGRPGPTPTPRAVVVVVRSKDRPASRCLARHPGMGRVGFLGARGRWERPGLGVSEPQPPELLFPEMRGVHP